MTNLDDLSARRAQLVAQCDLDRMRLTHAALLARQSMSPMNALRATPLASFALPVLAFALPLLAGGRRRGIVRVASLAFSALRALRGFTRRGYGA